MATGTEAAGGYDMGYQSYYLQDGTFVQVLPDGTELHYPPEGADAPAEDFVGTEMQTIENPLPQEFSQQDPPSLTKQQLVHLAAQQEQTQSINPQSPQTTAPPQPPPVEAEAPPGVEGSPRPPRTATPAPAAAALAEEVVDNEVEDRPQCFDMLSTIAMSSPFKMYSTALLCGSFCMFFVLGLNYLFATLYRIFSPPNENKSSFWQSAAFVLIFFFLSFFLSAVCCTTIDLIRWYWRLSRRDYTVWGITFGEKTPPYPVFACVILATTVVPFVWSLIATFVGGRTGVFFFQFFFCLALVITTCSVLVLLVWLFLRSLSQKVGAYRNRINDFTARMAFDVRRDLHVQAQEDGEERPPTPPPPPPPTSVSWYDSDAVLAELGLDTSVIMQFIAVFFLGFIPIVGFAALLATTGSNAARNYEWLFIGFAFVIALFGMCELKRRSRALLIVGVLLSIIAIGLIALISIGVSGNNWLFLIVGTLLVSTQCLLLRKRPQSVSPHEMETQLGQEVAFDMADEGVDTYLIPCHKVTAGFMNCCSEGSFKEKHAAVRQHESALRRDKIALWMDQRFLLYYWICFWLLLCGTLAYSAALSPEYGTTMAQVGSPVSPKLVAGEVHPMCRLSFLGGNATLYDLALLNTLSFSWGDAASKDFTKWFAGRFERVSPVAQEAADIVGDSTNVMWDTIRVQNAMQEIYVIRSTNRAQQFFRNVDIWGESLSLAVLGGLIPTVAWWPEDIKQNFIAAAAFLKDAYQGNDVTSALEAALRQRHAEGYDVLVVGHGFGGALGRIATFRTGSESVSFNSPGTSWMHKKFDVTGAREPAATIVNTDADLMSSIDRLEGESVLLTVRCGDPLVATSSCSEPKSIATALLTLCGDATGRIVT